jgi:DNA-binding NtrC family response regulator
VSSKRKQAGGKLAVLVIDDEPAVRFGIRDFLESHDFEVEEAWDRASAQQAFANRRPDAVVLDYLLTDGDTLSLLAKFKETDVNVPVLILTAHGSIDLAVRAIKEGADQFLTKPMDLPALLLLLQREIDNGRTVRKGRANQRKEERNGLINPFVGTSGLIKQLEEQTRKILAFDASVLIGGETGTGKGVLARWLHAHSPRAHEPFVDVNCALLSKELLESELFGHERGAFTGATQTKLGLLEIGDRGTVFLDEIGDMDMNIQPKLLTVIEEKRFRRLGEVRNRRVDVRIIAATNRDLRTLIQEKKFRSDLYFRINTITLMLPTLRERPEDIIPLARHILQTLSLELGRSAVLAPDAEACLQDYSWPGNLRELRNVLERALLLSSSNLLRPQDLHFEPGASPVPQSETNPDLTLDELERQHIERVIAQEGGHIERAAGRLGIPRSSLYDKVKRFRLRSKC